MGYASGLHRQVLFTIGLVLFVFIMVINVCLTNILKSGDPEAQEKKRVAKLAKEAAKHTPEKSETEGKEAVSL